MWLPMLLLAVMASGSACPDFCECHTPVIECRGHAPKLRQLDELPLSFAELKIRNVEQQEFGSYVGSKPNSTFLQRVQAVEVTNCSTLTNQHYLRWDVPRGGSLDFPVLMNVRSLNISHNNLKSIPDRCVLFKENIISRLRVLDASHNRIDNVVLNSCRHMFELTWLNLASNNLYYISPNSFKYLQSLEHLDMSDNMLQTLDKIFDSLRSLQRLNVAGNKLEHVQANWFQNLGKLIELDISRNKLTFVSADALRPLLSLSMFNLAENPLIERDLSLLLCTGRRLETVDASRLGLVRIPAALTRSVKTLKLTGNQLTSIYSGDLDSYPLLRLLDLSNNRVMIIEEDALGRLDNLETLIVSGNILPNIPKSLPSGLLKLDIRQNAISKLRVNDLQGIHVLKELYLSGNVISIIEEGSFRELLALQILDISDNPIKKLPSDTLSGPSNLMMLRMSGLMWLETEENQNQDTAFPVLTPERLVTLDISRSPALSTQFLADNAALSACKSLKELDLSYTNISTIRSDLAYVFPQLQKLNLIGNEWNCTEDQFWLGEWIRQHHNSINCSTRCSSPSDFEGKLLEEMPNLPTTESTKKMRVIERNAEIMKTSKTVYPTLTAEIMNKSKSNEPSLKTFAASSSTPKSVRQNYTTQQSLLPTINVQNKFNTSKIPEIVTTNSTLLQIQKISLKNEFSTPSSLKLEIHDFTTSNEVKPSEFPPAAEEYLSKTVKYESTEIPIESTTKINLIENIVEEDAVSTILNTEELFLTTNVNKKETNDITLITSTSEESKVTSNIPYTTLPTSTRLVEMSTNKVPFVKIKEIMTNKYEDSEKDNEISHKKSADAIYEFSRSKLLIANEEPRDNVEPNSIAEKLNSQTTESGAHTSEPLSNGTHPGMLVLLGAAIGAAAALTVVLSRRATVKRRDQQYHRHENIEVHALTPTMELW